MTLDAYQLCDCASLPSGADPHCPRCQGDGYYAWPSAAAGNRYPYRPTRRWAIVALVTATWILGWLRPREKR